MTRDTGVQVVKTEHSTEYKISSNAKMFRVLSSGLYSDKIKAVIRELSTNAYDAHVMNNNAHRPFEVALPSYRDEIFSIRDFGPGLSHEDAMELYTTYGESTKVEDARQTGCLGLGSKSPFAYTDSFFVISRHAGKKRTYLSTFFATATVPSFELISEEDTTDESGVEIKFSVPAANAPEWQSRAATVFQAFRVKPIYVDWYSKETKRSIPNVYDNEILPGVYKGMSQYDPVMVLQGNILYPVTQKTDLGESGIIVEFPIGSLGFAVSRESLEYTPETVSILAKRTTEVKKELDLLCEREWLACPTTYDKVQFLRNIGKHFSPSLSFLYDKYRNSPALMYYRDHTPLKYPQGIHSTGRMFDMSYGKHKEVFHYSYAKLKSLTIVYQDTSTLQINKVREHFRNKGNVPQGLLLVVTGSGKNLREIRNELDDFLAGPVEGFPFTLVPYSSISAGFTKRVRKVPVIKGAAGYRLPIGIAPYERTELVENMLYVIPAKDTYGNKQYCIGAERFSWPPTQSDVRTLSGLGIRSLCDNRPIYIIDEKYKDSIPKGSEPLNPFLLKKLQALKPPDQSYNIEKMGESILGTSTYGLFGEQVRKFIEEELTDSTLHNIIKEYSYKIITEEYKPRIDYSRLLRQFGLEPLPVVNVRIVAEAKVAGQVLKINNEYPVIREILKTKVILPPTAWIEVLRLLKR